MRESKISVESKRIIMFAPTEKLESERVIRLRSKFSTTKFSVILDKVFYL